GPVAHDLGGERGQVSGARGGEGDDAGDVVTGALGEQPGGGAAQGVPDEHGRLADHVDEEAGERVDDLVQADGERVRVARASHAGPVGDPAAAPVAGEVLGPTGAPVG